MRRVLSSVTVVLGVIGVTVGPGGTAAAARAEPAKKVCAIEDSKLVELSGMVARKSGYIVVNDGSDISDRRKVFFLDAKCKVLKVKSYPSMPRDTEDLGSPDGQTLYIADIGDNDLTRTSVVLWTMPMDGSAAPVLNRLTYPDGKHDAEALLFNGDGTPIIVTRNSGKAGLYSPVGRLKAGTGGGVPMKKLGELTLPKTTTSNWMGALGRLVVTGGATAPDRSRVVLRTYADAFEWDVTNGDVVAALTTGTPRATPLPDEPRGEAIAYSPDGKTFLTVSETADQPEGTRPEILSYPPATEAAPAVVEAGANRPGGSQSWLDKLSLQDITYLIGSVGVLGAILVGLGVFGILRARRKPPADDAGSNIGGPDEDPLLAPVHGEAYGGYADAGWDQRQSGPGDGYRADYPGEEYEDRGHRQGPAGGVYGGGLSGGGGYGAGSSGGAVYGGRGKPSGGAVYGGGSSGAGGHADDGRHSGRNGYAETGYSNNGYHERAGRYGQSVANQPDYPDDRHGYR